MSALQLNILYHVSATCRMLNKLQQAKSQLWDFLHCFSFCFYFFLIKKTHWVLKRNWSRWNHIKILLLWGWWRRRPLVEMFFFSVILNTLIYEFQLNNLNEMNGMICYKKLICALIYVRKVGRRVSFIWVPLGKKDVLFFSFGFFKKIFSVYFQFSAVNPELISYKIHIEDVEEIA